MPNSPECQAGRCYLCPEDAATDCWCACHDDDPVSEIGDEHA